MNIHGYKLRVQEVKRVIKQRLKEDKEFSKTLQYKQLMDKKRRYQSVIKSKKADRVSKK